MQGLGQEDMAEQRRTSKSDGGGTDAPRPKPPRISIIQMHIMVTFVHVASCLDPSGLVLDDKTAVFAELLARWQLEGQQRSAMGLSRPPGQVRWHCQPFRQPQGRRQCEHCEDRDT